MTYKLLLERQDIGIVQLARLPSAGLRTMRYAAVSYFIVIFNDFCQTN